MSSNSASVAALKAAVSLHQQHASFRKPMTGMAANVPDDATSRQPGHGSNARSPHDHAVRRFWARVKRDTPVLLPPEMQQLAGSRPSRGFCLYIDSCNGIALPRKAVEDIRDPTVMFRLQASFFHRKANGFFGSTFHGLPCAVAEKTDDGKSLTIRFDVRFKTALFFQTAHYDDNNQLAVEIVAEVSKDGCMLRTVSCGWTLLEIFDPSKGFNSDLGRLKLDPAAARRSQAPLFRSTPRLLLSVDRGHDILLQQGKHVGSLLEFSFMSHRGMTPSLRLFHSNSIFHGTEIIPGLLDATTAAVAGIAGGPPKAPAPKFFAPIMQETSRIHLANFKIALPEKFEEELLKTIYMSLFVGYGALFDSTFSPSISRRTLWVGYHTSRTFAKPAVEVNLNVDGERERFQTLFFNGSIEVDGVFAHPFGGLVLEVEYEINIPQPRRPQKQRSGASRSDISFVPTQFTVAQVVAMPFDGLLFSASDASFNVSLRSSAAEDASGGYGSLLHPWRPVYAHRPGVAAGAAGSAPRDPVAIEWRFQSPSLEQLVRTAPVVAADLSVSQSLAASGFGSTLPLSTDTPPAHSADNSPRVSPVAPVHVNNTTLLQDDASTFAGSSVPPTASAAAGYSLEERKPHAKPRKPKPHQATLGAAEEQDAAKMQLGAAPDLLIGDMGSGFGLRTPQLPKQILRRLFDARFPEIRSFVPPTVIEKLSPLVRDSLERVFDCGTVHSQQQQQGSMTRDISLEIRDHRQHHVFVVQLMGMSSLSVSQPASSTTAKSVLQTRRLEFELRMWDHAPQRSGVLLSDATVTDGVAVLRREMGSLSASSSSSSKAGTGSAGALETTMGAVQPGHGFVVEIHSSHRKMRDRARRKFFQYLAEKSLFLDVFDADSKFYLGCVAVCLRNLLRQGADLSICTAAYPVIADSEMAAAAAVQQQQQQQMLVILRVANVAVVGGASDDESAAAGSVLASHEVLAGRPPGEASAASPTAMQYQLIPRLADEHAELRQAKPRTAGGVMSRIEQARKKFGQSPYLAQSNQQEQQQQQQQQQQKQQSATGDVQEIDFKVLARYREASKPMLLSQRLRENLLEIHRLYVCCGETGYLEVSLANPFPENDQVFRVDVSDCLTQNIKLVTDAEEWRCLRSAFGTGGVVEEELFHDLDATSYSLFLRGGEHVSLPFRFFGAESVIGEAKIFATDSGAPVRLVQIQVVVQPPVLSRVFRFPVAEHEFVRKCLDFSEGFPVEKTTFSSGEEDLRGTMTFSVQEKSAVAGMQRFVRLSAAERTVAQCSVRRSVHDPVLVFFKHKSLSLPETVLMHVYEDRFCVQLLSTVELRFIPYRRKDMMGLVGQISKEVLLVENESRSLAPAPGAASRNRLLKVFCSRPDVLSVDPAYAFYLNAGSRAEIALSYGPVSEQVSGSHVPSLTTRGTAAAGDSKDTALLHVVDMDADIVYLSYLLFLSARTPVISKSFELAVSRGQSINKKVAYRNPYGQTRTFGLKSSVPDRVHFREEVLSIAADDKAYIHLIFTGADREQEDDVLVFVMDETDDRIEECLAIKLRTIR